jgi:hypothetical protein
LARAYIRFGIYEMLPARQAHSSAKTAATKALEIDQTLPEGHGPRLRRVPRLGLGRAQSSSARSSSTPTLRILMPRTATTSWWWPPATEDRHMAGRRADPMSSGRRAALGWGTSTVSTTRRSGWRGRHWSSAAT